MLDMGLVAASGTGLGPEGGLRSGKGSSPARQRSADAVAPERRRVPRGGVSRTAQKPQHHKEAAATVIAKSVIGSSVSRRLGCPPPNRQS